jgi:hypothetical protein
VYPLIVATNGVDSEAVPEAGVGVPDAQETLTDTDPALFGMKSLFTVKVSTFWVFVIVQEWLPPTEIATPAHGAWLAAYPPGTVSVAVQVAPTLKPVIVVTNGVDSEAEPEAGDGVPLVQATLTATLAALFGSKSLFTVRVALFSVFAIVQETLLPLNSVTAEQFVWLAV